MATKTNNDDPDLTDSTTSDNQPVDMDDMTGSNGGSPEDRSSEVSDDTSDSSYSVEPNKSRSDTSRVDDIGVSGGTGDADSSQSGGRSQY